jgi:hypothetical protein
MTHKGILESQYKISGDVLIFTVRNDGRWNKNLHFMVKIYKGRTQSLRRNMDSTITNPVI